MVSTTLKSCGCAAEEEISGTKELPDLLSLLLVDYRRQHTELREALAREELSAAEDREANDVATLRKEVRQMERVQADQREELGAHLGNLAMRLREANTRNAQLEVALRQFRAEGNNSGGGSHGSTS